MRSSEKKQNIKKANLIAESLHIERLLEDYDYAAAEREFHDKSYDDYDEELAKYVNDVKQELMNLNAGETIVKVLNKDFTGTAAKYKNSTWVNLDKFFKNNFDKGFSAKDTADNLRARWYGV